MPFSQEHLLTSCLCITFGKSSNISNFSLLLYLLWWFVISDHWCYYCKTIMTYCPEKGSHATFLYNKMYMSKRWSWNDFCFLIKGIVIAWTALLLSSCHLKIIFARAMVVILGCSWKAMRITVTEDWKIIELFQLLPSPPLLVM